MRYAGVLLPFASRQLANDRHVAVSATGDHAFFSSSELQMLRQSPDKLPLEQLANLRARFLVGSASPNPGLNRLAASRVAAKRETISVGPSLHIIVPTLQCAHSCRYCQVSRSLDDTGHTMSENDLYAACDTIFQSPSKALTVEFQGGDPLLRFDLVRRAVLRIAATNRSEGRRLRFVVASTLHQLDDEMCSFFREHQVFLSTSIDGPAELHNKNRPVPTRDAFERTLAGIELARRELGQEAVSALMTTTRASLLHPEAIVDEYVRLGFRDIFVRPLSAYGFAMRNLAHLGYSLDAFADFYSRALERVLHWNQQGVELREVYAAIILNKILSPFDSGYVDLQSPTGAGSSVLVYNYDGYVYPSDEARMLLETGDNSLRLGRIGAPLDELRHSPVRLNLERASRVEDTVGCRECAYSLVCAPNPVDALAQSGSMFAPVHMTEHCRRHLWMFDSMFQRLDGADDWTQDLFYQWASPADGGTDA
jgi:His-Xaa-Ser system radical SAM maturase HxsB